jgi:glutathione S-transferase
MLKLYDYLPSQNGFKIRLLLQHLRQPYQHVPVAIFQGESRTPEFLEKNPVGAIPVLEPEPGVYIAESNAILCYLGEGTAYLPAERLARARVMQWLFFEQYYVEPTIGTLRFWVLANKVKANEALATARGARTASEPAFLPRQRQLLDRRHCSVCVQPSGSRRAFRSELAAVIRALDRAREGAVDSVAAGLPVYAGCYGLTRSYGLAPPGIGRFCS